MLHGNVGTCITGSRIKRVRVTFYIPALQKVNVLIDINIKYTCLSY